MHSTSGNPFTCNGPEASVNIVTLPCVMACVWHLGSQCCMISLTTHMTVTCRLAHYEKCMYMQAVLCNIIQ
jgi:hypothetical protein